MSTEIYPGSRVKVPDDRRLAKVVEIYTAHPCGGVTGDRCTYAKVDFDFGGHATYHLDALVNALDLVKS